MPALSQYPDQHVSELLVVFDGQDRTRGVIGPGVVGIVRGFDFSRPLGGGRQVNRECRSMSYFAIDCDIPSALPDKTVGHRQPQARAFSGGLRGEKRIEGVSPRFCVHSDTGV